MKDHPLSMRTRSTFMAVIGATMAIVAGWLWWKSGDWGMLYAAIVCLLATGVALVLQYRNRRRDSN